MFFKFFKAKFKIFHSIEITRKSPNFHSLPSVHALGLEVKVTIDEIKNIVWYCGGEKALVPDGFTFYFVKKVLVFVKRRYFRIDG